MKKLLLILAVAFWTNSAQSQVADTAFVFTGIENLDSTVTAEQVFDRARRWMADAFVSSKEVIQIADKQNGEIVGKGNFKVTFMFMGGMSTGDGAVDFKVRILVKDHRYKYEFSDFYHRSLSVNYPSYGLVTTAAESPNITWAMVGKGYKNKYWHDLQNDSKKNIEQIIAGMKKFMATPTENTGW